MLRITYNRWCPKKQWSPTATIDSGPATPQ
jgi:hypothetical protein